MNNIQINNVIMVIGNRVWVKGKELPPAPIKGNNYTSSVIGNKVYINGYEFKRGKWRRTLRALWHMWF